ncbi:hypothetical protein MMC29_000728 [Sticta canariensis]|nr:hypothetical protein [Sticta canariensis]
MSVEFPDEESFTSEEPLRYTPPESLPDETSSENTYTSDTMRQDDRPETSPYITPIFTLLVGSDRVQYTIQEGFLHQSPLWAEKCKSKPWGNKIALPDVDKDIGHSLVHYLYTGNYQTMKPQTISEAGPGGAIIPTETDKEREYRRSVLLYCVARTYGLDELKHLSMHHIEIPQDDISIWDVLDIAKEAYEKLPDDEVWFTEHLRWKLEDSLRVDKFLFKRPEFLGRIGKVKKFDQSLMKIIAEIYTEKHRG